MATIEELDRAEEELRAAEGKALRDLADHLRNAVVPLPPSSGVATLFHHYAPKVEDVAAAADPGWRDTLTICTLAPIVRRVGDYLKATMRDGGTDSTAESAVLAEMADQLSRWADRLPDDSPLRDTLCDLFEAIP